jgi:type VI secretion system protein ImpK
MSDDPFAEPSDSERTIIRPRPGGQAVPVPSAPLPAARPAEPSSPLPATGANPLIAAAAPLLAAAVRIAGGRGRNPDPEQLRRAMVEAVRDFERRALATGLDTRSLRAARYALCATLDDIVLSTPWGAASAWPAQSLTSIFHNEVSGGERFFDILDQMQKDLGHHQAVVELMYLCMSIGFEGRYRVLPRGVAALTDLRDSIYRSIRQRRGDFERELSPHWKGLALPAARLSGGVPLWAVALGTVALACAIYAGFNFALAGRSDIAFAELFGLPPKGPIAVARAEPGPPPPPPPPAPAPAQIVSLTSKLHSFLAPEIREGLVTVLEDAQSVTVRLTNRNMFASGQASLNPASQPLLNRIGDALREEQGDIVVNGYTDNQPIHSVRFPSNFELSQARADAVGALIKARLADPNRLKTAGHADADPIAPNTTPDGRQANRRTEIVLTRSGGAT